MQDEHTPQLLQGLGFRVTLNRFGVAAVMNSVHPKKKQTGQSIGTNRSYIAAAALLACDASLLIYTELSLQVYTAPPVPDHSRTQKQQQYSCEGGFVPN